MIFGPWLKNERTAGRLCLALALALWGVLSPVPATAAPEPVISVQSVGPAEGPGNMWEAMFFFLNPGSEPATFTLPERIRWRGVGPDELHGGDFVRVSAATEAVIPVSGFVRERYRADLPDSWVGIHEFEVPRAAGARLTVDLMPQPKRAGPDQGESAGSERRRGFMLDLSPVGPRELPGQAFFRRHFSGYEPFYIVWGPESPNVKFQVSVRYRIVNPEAEMGPWWAWSRGMHVAYTQTSLWDFDKPSAPFFDSSYKPELIWREDDLFPGAVNWWRQLGLQLGLQHESNGKDGADSRGLNVVYMRPTFVFGQVTNLFVAASPRFMAYVGGLSGNPDIRDYRGFMDLTLKGGWAHGLQVAGLFRAGDDFTRGSMQIDVTYPTVRILGNVDLLLHAQYFNGWGESLLEYDERTWMYRVGVSLFR